MRRLGATVLAVGVGVALGAGWPTRAAAQEQGSMAFDAMTTPGRHFGMGFYLSERLSIRPSLGFGYAQDYGAVLNLGTDARFELLPGSRFSPYLTAGFNYQRNPYLVSSDSAGAIRANDTDVARFGGGAGLRTRIKYGISLVGEGRVMNSAIRDIPGSFGAQTVQDGAHFEAAIGLSYIFN